MATKIDTPTARKRLAARREPYWHKLGKGKAVGYRAGSDTWVARWRNVEDKQEYNPLGLKGYDPKEVFEVACAQARTWFDQCEGGGNVVLTVQQGCDEYLDDLEIRKGEKARKDAEGRVTRCITDSLGNKRIDRLTTAQVEKWRNDLVNTDGDDEAVNRSKDSANRTLTTLKAAMNYSARIHKIVNRTAWQDVKPFPNVGKARELYLTNQQMKDLLEATEGGLHTIIEAGRLTGARLGELMSATAGDFDKKAGTLKVTGKTGERNIVLSDEALKFFKAYSADMLPKAVLLPRDDGKAWDRHFLSKRFREARKKAKLPADATFYSLRHWYISKALQAGVDIELLARNVGNSAEIIRKHYHKFIQSDVRDQMNKLGAL